MPDTEENKLEQNTEAEAPAPEQEPKPEAAKETPVPAAEETSPEQEPAPAGKGKRVAAGLLAAALIAGGGYGAWWWFRDCEPVSFTGIEPLTVYLDDEDIPGMIMDGVSAQAGPDRKSKPFEVSYEIYPTGAVEGASAKPGEPAAASECEPVSAEDLAVGEYRIVYSVEDRYTPDGTEVPLTVLPADHEGPEITGTKDIIAGLGETVSYRSGVSAVDAVDGEVQLKIDSSAVDLNTLGDYPVKYSAVDRRGNSTELTVNLKVVDRSEADENGPIWLAEETLDELTDGILAKILKDGMSQYEQAKAIYNYVHNNVRYVNGTFNEDWRRGAYTGFTRGRGDCFTYYSCSKALLERAGIPNLDMERYGGTTEHYWNLVNTGDGWYHFDACPYPIGYPMNGFMIDEAEARAYTERCKSRVGYYVYDYSKCPVTVVGTPSAEVSTGSALEYSPRS